MKMQKYFFLYETSLLNKLILIIYYIRIIIDYIVDQLYKIIIYQLYNYTNYTIIQISIILIIQFCYSIIIQMKNDYVFKFVYLKDILHNIKYVFFYMTNIHISNLFFIRYVSYCIISLRISLLRLFSKFSLIVSIFSSRYYKYSVS